LRPGGTPPGAEGSPLGEEREGSPKATFRPAGRGSGGWPPAHALETQEPKILGQTKWTIQYY